ncbi:MAG: hypothetical protein Q8P26_00985 [Candidatus Levybacteria bacterium]|nr:hypothetical protein [Candidatus Levybacteria bacterium]
MVIKERPSSYTGLRTFKDDPTGWRAVDRVKPNTIDSLKKQIRPKDKRSTFAPSEVIFSANKHNGPKPGEIPTMRIRIHEIEVTLQELNQKGKLTSEEQEVVRALKAELKPLKIRLHH